MSMMLGSTNPHCFCQSRSIDAHRLKNASLCDEKEDMKDIDPPSLRPEELIALVQQLHQQLTERDQEIENLKRQLAERQAPAAVGDPIQRTPPVALEESSPGTQEELLAQLGKIYPEGR
jgi:hypothetical protein